MTRSQSAYLLAFAIITVGCTPLPDAPMIEQKAYGEIPPRDFRIEEKKRTNPDRAYFRVSGVGLSSYYLVSDRQWRHLPRNPAAREQALIDGGFGPNSIYGEVSVRRNRDYYFIPVCANRPDFSKMRSLPAGMVGYIREAILRC